MNNPFIIATRGNFPEKETYGISKLSILNYFFTGLQCDSAGRPFHHMFFTGRPNYYNLMHVGSYFTGDYFFLQDAVYNLELLKNEEDRVNSRRESASPPTVSPMWVPSFSRFKSKFHMFRWTTTLMRCVNELSLFHIQNRVNVLDFFGFSCILHRLK